MRNRPLFLLLMVALCGLGLLFAREAKKKTGQLEQTKVVKLHPTKKLERFNNVAIQLDEPVANADKKSAPRQLNARQDVVFFDDFEGGQGAWQAGATWGINTTAGGYSDEDKSDWEVATDNFNSATTSWHETGETFLSTDMLFSPAFTIPETVEGNVTGRVDIDFYIDWDMVDALNGLYVYLGLDAPLWTQDETDPGAGTKSFSIHNPGTPPFDVFSRQYLTTPEIDLTGATGTVTLDFLYKSISEPEFDYNKVDVLMADDNYVSSMAVASFDGPDGSAGGGTATWTAHSADLTAFDGKVIKLRFSENGDYGFVQGGAIFAVDDITVSDDNGVIYQEDAEAAEPNVTIEGFAPGSALVNFTAAPSPSPNWLNVAVPANALTGASGNISLGDNVRLGFVFAYDASGGGAQPVTGRGLYIDDVNVTARAVVNDLAAVSVNVPFPAKVGEALTFELNVLNNGANPQSNIQWQGAIINTATNTQVASVVGQRAEVLPAGETAVIPSLTKWTPAAPGIYRVRAFTRLATDEDRTNDTTNVASDDADGFGDGRYSPFVVCEKNVLFSASLWDLPEDPTVATLNSQGFALRSNSAPGVVTWQNTNSALVPFVNLGVNYSGAYIQFDSVGAGRPQDEWLIIPNLDFSSVTSNATLAFKGLGVLGFTWSRFTVGVSNDGGATWQDVFLRQRGVDPQTGINYGGPAFFTAGQRPAALDITRWAAGYSNVSIRFRYEGLGDADYTVWNVSVCGKGVQAATLSSVEDIPMDQGKQVRVSWTASPNDGQLNGVPITEYGVWREVTGTNKAGESGNVIHAERLIDALADMSKIKAGTRVEVTGSAQQFDFVAAVPAHPGVPDYSYVAPTLADGVETCYIISAHTANPKVYALSNMACGTSTDDLAPNAVTLSGEAQSGFVQLGWTEPDNERAASYNVYRRLATEPSFGNAIASSEQIEFQDDTIDRTTSYIYAVTAIDFAGNESAFSNEVPVVTTAVAGRGNDRIPTEFALDQNHPNPFNPTTTLSYQLPKNALVRLTIFNSLGQEVRTLVDNELAAGYHQTVWDGRDNAGQIVGSGIYMYIIEAGDFVQTKKMILMK